MTKLLQSRYGIIRSLNEFVIEIGDAPISIFGSDVGDTRAIGGEGEISAVGGAHENRQQAIMASVGEAIERYAAAFPSDIILSSAENLQNPVLGWPEFTKKQYENYTGYKPLRSNTVISWTSGWNLQTMETHYLPASLIYLPWYPRDGETSIFPSISTGLAAHKSMRRAIESGLYEVIERDAFTLAWLSGQPLPVVPQNWVDNFCQKNRIPSTWRVKMIDLTNNTRVPTYLFSLFAPTSIGEIFAIGTASHRSPLVAATKALAEAMHTVPYARHMIRSDPNWHPGDHLENLKDFADHCRVYSVMPELQEGLKYIHPEEIIHEAPLPPDNPMILPSFEMIVERMNNLGIDLYVKRLTTRDMVEEGWEVAKVLSPQMMPLNAQYQLPHINCTRFQQLEDVFPFPIKTLENEEEVFAYPHPFA